MDVVQNPSFSDTLHLGFSYLLTCCTFYFCPDLAIYSSCRNYMVKGKEHCDHNHYCYHHLSTIATLNSNLYSRSSSTEKARQDNSEEAVTPSYLCLPIYPEIAVNSNDVHKGDLKLRNEGDSDEEASIADDLYLKAKHSTMVNITIQAPRLLFRWSF